jgi:hypothetical protein
MLWNVAKCYEMLKTVKINVTLNVTLKKLNVSYQMLPNVT